MAICPFARWRPLPETWTQPRRSGRRLVIFHEAVSRAASLHDFFNSTGIYVESHFYVDEFGGLDQYMDTDVVADANVMANPRAISVETWDDGGDVGGEWNPAQLATNKRLAAWLAEVDGTPAQVPPNPWGEGIGWHNLFAEEWADGPRACPGARRAAQVRDKIIPYVAAGGGWQAEETDDMPFGVPQPVQWEPGTKKWGVIAVPPVGQSISIGAKGEAWLHLRCPHQPVTIHGLWFVTVDGQVAVKEFQLRHDTYNRGTSVWQLPAGCHQISALYTADVPIGATLETRFAA